MERETFLRHINNIPSRAALISLVVAGSLIAGHENTKNATLTSDSDYKVPNFNSEVENSCHLFGSPNWVDHNHLEWNCYVPEKYDPKDTRPDMHVNIYGRQGEEVEALVTHFQGYTEDGFRKSVRVTDLTLNVPYGESITVEHTLYEDCEVTISNTDSQPQVIKTCE